MDTLTHIITGAAIGEACLGRRIGKSAMLWGAVAANAPDVDALTSFFVSDLDALLLHRGITHSVIVALFVGGGLGWIFSRIYGSHRGHLIPWILLFTVNWLFHEFLDTATMYGTSLMLPFSDHRYAFNNIFVVDPLFTVPVAFTTLVLLMMRMDDPRRKNWNRGGMVLSSFYMVLTFASQSFATASLKRTMALKGIEAYRHFTVPTLFNSALWNVVAETDSGYWSGYVSVFDQSDFANVYFIKKDLNLERSFNQDIRVQKLRKFSNGFGLIKPYGDHVVFCDLRFGQINGWYNPDSRFGFEFNLAPGADNSMVVQQGRIEGMQPLIISGMLRRIRGNLYP